MTKDTELESLAGLFLEASRECLKSDGYLSPMMIARKRKKAIVFSLPHDQDAWFFFAMTILRSLRAQSYFVTFEAWAVPTDQTVETVPLSENPARTEHMFVFGCERSGGRVALFQQFVHDPGGITFLKPIRVCRKWDSWMPVPGNW
jgi:hypothetical protein